MVTDLPKRTTQLIGKATKHVAEAQAMQELLQNMPNGEQYIAFWRDYVARFPRKPAGARCRQTRDGLSGVAL